MTGNFYGGRGSAVALRILLLIEASIFLWYGIIVLVLDREMWGSLKAGDCLVESPNGVVDAGVATQLRLVEQAVRNVMK